RLTQANAKISLIETLVSMMGPAFAGLLLLISDLSGGLLLTALLFAVSLIAISRLPVQTVTPARADRKLRFLADFRESWDSFRSNRLLLVMTIFVMFSNCSIIVVQTCLVFHAKDVLHLSSSMTALTLSAAGIGGLIGSMLIGRLRIKLGLGNLYGFVLLLHAASTVLLASLHSIAIFVIALIMIGFSFALYNISIYTIRHEQTPPHFMGRIAGITGTLFRTGMPIAMYLSGWVIEAWGTAAVFTGAAVWNLLIFLLFIRSPLRKAN
ncbi:MAG: MFS transporter, partial [Paenibacillus sp.]|uniref:MFS transporter n=1 Tax=Paenibacillus sp. TaxID=58172 RepID=UPI002904BA3F